jgi:hypothetical protein
MLQPSPSHLEPPVWPTENNSREKKPEFYVNKFFELLCEHKKILLELNCSPHLIACLTRARECREQQHGKLELLIACCKVICYINFDLIDYNFEIKTP